MRQVIIGSPLNYSLFGFIGTSAVQAANYRMQVPLAIALENDINSAATQLCAIKKNLYHIYEIVFVSRPTRDMCVRLCVCHQYIAFDQILFGRLELLLSWTMHNVLGPFLDILGETKTNPRVYMYIRSYTHIIAITLIINRTCIHLFLSLSRFLTCSHINSTFFSFKCVDLVSINTSLFVHLVCFRFIRCHLATQISPSNWPPEIIFNSYIIIVHDSHYAVYALH